MTNDNRIRFTFRLPKDLYNQLGVIAEKKGVSINALILQIIWDYFKKEEK